MGGRGGQGEGKNNVEGMCALAWVSVSAFSAKGRGVEDGMEEGRGGSRERWRDVEAGMWR